MMSARRRKMAAQPNLAGKLRLGYTLTGLALIAWGFFMADSETSRLIAPILGGVLLIEGLIGYCPACALLGLGSRKQDGQKE